MKPLKEKKPFQAPHTFVILVALILLAVAATYVVPAGEYTRYTDEATNRTLVEAGSFHYVESHPVSFLTVPALIYRAIVKAASTVTFILIIGGSFEIITSTGILTVLCKKMAKAFRGREYFVIPAFLLLFSVFGTTMGMSAEVMIFVPIGIALAASLGLDKVTGTAMIAMGAASGFTAGILNPFNVGVAQDIAEIPMFSGMGYRIFILGVLLVIDTVYITWYAKRVKADPTKSIIYGEPEDQEFTFDDTEEALNLTHGLTLAVIVAGFAVLIYGLSKLGWYFEEMSAIFIAMGVLCGIVNRYSPNKIAATFGNGAKGIVVGALIVGIARGVELALSDAMILDTIVHAIASIVNILPQFLKAIGNVPCTVTCQLCDHLRYRTGRGYHAAYGTGCGSDRYHETDSRPCVPARRRIFKLCSSDILCADGLSRRFEDPVCKMVKIHDAVILDLDILRMSVHAWGTHDRLLRRRKREDAGF